MSDQHQMSQQYIKSPMQNYKERTSARRLFFWGGGRELQTNVFLYFVEKRKYPILSYACSVRYHVVAVLFWSKYFFSYSVNKLFFCPHFPHFPQTIWLLWRQFVVIFLLSPSRISNGASLNHDVFLSIVPRVTSDVTYRGQHIEEMWQQLYLVDWSTASTSPS